MGMAGDEWAQEAGTAALLREKPDPNVVYEAETLYGHVAVRQIAERPDTRAFVQDKLTRSEMVVNDATHLRSFYQRVCAGLTRGLSGGKKNPSMLVLGAGGYALPRYLRATWPDSRLEVVEIDPGVTKAATEAFGLDEGTAHRDDPHGRAGLCGSTSDDAGATGKPPSDTISSTKMLCTMPPCRFHW